MPYRPQFAFAPLPQSSVDSKGKRIFHAYQRSHYSFDGTNTRFFSGTIAAGLLIRMIPLEFDKDSSFFMRGIQIGKTSLQIGLEDAYGNVFIDPIQPGLPILLPSLWAHTNGAGIVTLEGGNWGSTDPFPPGAKLYAYVFNPTVGALAGPVITIHGIKQFSGEQCPK